MLVLNRGINEWIDIEPAGIRVKFLGFSREGLARIGVTAPDEQDVIRGELCANWVRRKSPAERTGRAKDEAAKG